MAADKEKITIKTESKTTIRGYGIELNDEKLSRIDQMVESYEKRVAARLDEDYEQHTSRSDRVADKVAAFGGSWKFIILFGEILTLWIIFNVIAIGKYKYDPYPFILMNLILSCIAALQAPVIMMSQNRQEEKDRKNSENDYLINLKAEMQIRSLNQKIDILLEKQIKTLFETQEKQFTLLKEINTKLEGHLAKKV